jgi:hypothetical protein
MIKINFKQRFLLALAMFAGAFSVMAQDGLYPFEDKGRYGFINQSGKVIVQGQYSFADQFYDGLAVVKEKGKKGYIDKTGKMVIQWKR